MKGLPMRYLNMKYQSPNPYTLKVEQKVKVKVTRSKIIVSNKTSGHGYQDGYDGYSGGYQGPPQGGAPGDEPSYSNDYHPSGVTYGQSNRQSHF